MRIMSLFLWVLVTGIAFTDAAAQTIDAGRGEIPLVVPASYNKAKPVPLVVLLHGYTSSGSGQNAYMKISSLTNNYGFLFIAPDGTQEDSERKSRFWNATKACCNFSGSTVDDSTYISNLIAEVKKQYSVDPSRVYLIGHSNGGFMSHRIALDHPDTIAAIASLAGVSPNTLKGPKAKYPVNILQIHGTKDSTIRYEGGVIKDVAYPSAMETVQKWAAYNAGSTQAKSVRKKLDLDKRLDGKETTITRFNNGSVELWTINEGGHIPSLSENFSKQVIEWLMAHPKDTSQID